MKNLWFLFWLAISGSAMGQPSVKIHAYSQVMMPGTVPKDVTDENGNLVNVKRELPVNYYIYAVHVVSAKISFSEVWINGKYYKIQTNHVDTTPVVNINYNIPDNPVKVVLVPATKLRVVSIAPVDSPVNKMNPETWLRNMIEHSELVVCYIYRGKKYYIGVKKIKKLQPVAGI